MEGGKVEMDNTGKIFSHVRTHLSKRGRLTFMVPCCRGAPFDVGDTAFMTRILQGTYDCPPNTDPAMCLLFEEAVYTFVAIPGEEISTYITVVDSQHYWK